MFLNDSWLQDKSEKIKQKIEQTVFLIFEKISSSGLVPILVKTASLK